jgi:hypothetical protein
MKGNKTKNRKLKKKLMTKGRYGGKEMKGNTPKTITVKLSFKNYLNHMTFEQWRYVEILERDPTAFRTTRVFLRVTCCILSLQIDKIRTLHFHSFNLLSPLSDNFHLLMIGNDINDFFLNEQLPVTTKTVVIFN